MSDTEGGGPGGPGPEARPQMPIGGMYRDPREVKTNPTLTKFLRERMSAAIIGSLVAIGFVRPRTANGELGRRSWRGLVTFLLAIFAIVIVYTSVHVVQPGTVGVPVTFGHPGKALSPGLHISLPFTSVSSMPTRTQNYTMSSAKGEGEKNVDDSVAVLGRDGGAAAVNATVLYQIEASRATAVYRNLGTNYATAIVRPSARSCIRSVFTQNDIVEAATKAWTEVETNVRACMVRKFGSSGLVLQDFQLREVGLSPPVQKAVDAKVAAQQVQEQQQFELATAQQQAEITRLQALATSDSQQILACGGKAIALTRKDGSRVSTVVPNPLDQCSQSQFTQPYLQFTYIQALKQLVNSPNNSTLILPFDKNLTPLLQVPSGTNSDSTTP